MDFEKVGLRLAAGLTAAGTLLGFLGAKDGALTRILRNEGWEFFLALLLVLLGILFGLVASALATHKVWATILLVGAVAVFFGGTIWMSNLAIESTSAKERPQIEAKLVRDESGSLVLDGNVKAEGLTVEEHILIRVVGRSQSARFYSGRTGRKEVVQAFGDVSHTNLLFGLRAGPGSDGKVERAFSVPISPGIYDEIDVEATIETEAEEPSEARPCTAATRTFGCLALWVPQVPTAPQLFVSWDNTGSSSSLKIQVKGDDMNAEEITLLEVIGEGDAQTGNLIQRSSLPPSRNGTLDSSIVVPVPSTYKRICVTAVVHDFLKGGRGSNPFARGPDPYLCPNDSPFVMATEVIVPNGAGSSRDSS